MGDSPNGDAFLSCDPATGGALAVLLNHVAGLSGITAFLASSPGALSQMAVLSKETGGDTLLVVAVHTIRVIAVLVVAPVIARWIAPR